MNRLVEFSQNHSVRL